MFKKFFSNCSGAASIEYAMIGALVSIAVVIGATAIGTKLPSRFQPIANALS